MDPRPHSKRSPTTIYCKLNICIFECRGRGDSINYMAMFFDIVFLFLKQSFIKEVFWGGILWVCCFDTQKRD